MNTVEIGKKNTSTIDNITQGKSGSDYTQMDQLLGEGSLQNGRLALQNHAFPTGATCSNYKTEVEAPSLIHGVIKSFPTTKTIKFVLLSDAKSVLQALNNHKHQFFPKISQLLEEVANISSRIALQWIPGHRQIKGNEQADSLAKEESTMN